MSDVTQLLERARQGDQRAAEELLPPVYEELRRLAAFRMAREGPGHTLQPTALVHEAWLRVAGDADGNWNGRGHFFAAAAEAMRRILVENARRKRAIRHGGNLERVELDGVEVPATIGEDRLLRIHDALEALSKVDTRQAEIVKLRYFVGLSVEEIAAVQGTSTKTIQRDWNHAKAWLYEHLQSEE